MNRPARVALVASVAATLALTGCAGIPSGVSASAGRFAAAASADPQRPEPLLARLEAAAVAQETVETNFSWGTMEGSGTVLLGGDPAGNYVLNMGDTSTLMVTVDGVVYFKDGAVSAARWTSMPARGVVISAAFTPQGLFALMRAGATSVEDLGLDDGFGAPTRRYRLSSRTSGGPSTAEVTQVSDTADPPATVYTVWVGEGGLTQRVVVTTHGGELVVDFWRWGESMEVVAPPADEVDPASAG